MDARESKQDFRLGIDKVIVILHFWERVEWHFAQCSELTNKTRLAVSEPWRGFCVTLHVKFTESRIILTGKLIHKFYTLQFRRVPANVKLVVRKLKSAQGLKL